VSDALSGTSSQRHIVVVGMHRSGTSAVTNAIHELGVGLPHDTTMIGTGPYNEKGHWESQELARFDEALLRHLGGTWAAPPVPEPGWERSDDPAFVSLRERALGLADRCFSRPPIVIKDPRLCITLPLWRSVLGRQPCAVLIVRDPLEVARSLQTRDGFPLTLGLAIWERYVQHSVRSVAGMPVFALEYEALLDEPAARIGELAEFVRSCGIEVPPQRLADAAEVLEQDLRHHQSSENDQLSNHHREVLEILRASYGPHDEWSTPLLPDEPGWVDDVVWLTAAGLAVTASLDAARNELKWIKRSRLFRTSRAFWRATGTGPELSGTDQGETGRAAALSNGRGAGGATVDHSDGTR
jgi:hypothetical protein